MGYINKIKIFYGFISVISFLALHKTVCMEGEPADVPVVDRSSRPTTVTSGDDRGVPIEYATPSAAELAKKIASANQARMNLPGDIERIRAGDLPAGIPRFPPGEPEQSYSVVQTNAPTYDKRESNIIRYLDGLNSLSQSTNASENLKHLFLVDIESNLNPIIDLVNSGALQNIVDHIRENMQYNRVDVLDLLLEKMNSTTLRSANRDDVTKLVNITMQLLEIVPPDVLKNASQAFLDQLTNTFNVLYRLDSVGVLPNELSGDVAGQYAAALSTAARAVQDAGYVQRRSILGYIADLLQYNFITLWFRKLALYTITALGNALKSLIKMFSKPEDINAVVNAIGEVYALQEQKLATASLLERRFFARYALGIGSLNPSFSEVMTRYRLIMSDAEKQTASDAPAIRNKFLKILKNHANWARDILLGFAPART